MTPDDRMVPTVSGLGPGFGDGVGQSQAAFRAVLRAMSRPGTVEALAPAGAFAPPLPLTPAAAAVGLTLFDFETPVYLSEDPAGAGSAVEDYLRFHTGAPMVAQADAAAFALIFNGLETPPLSVFQAGSDQAPETSTTVIVQVASLVADGEACWRLTGPGIDGAAAFSVAGLRDDFADDLIANQALFPRGVDVILAAPDRIAALPRTTRVEA